MPLVNNKTARPGGLEDKNEKPRNQQPQFGNQKKFVKE
jgi:hypothetical protein